MSANSTFKTPDLVVDTLSELVFHNTASSVQLLYILTGFPQLYIKEFGFAFSRYYQCFRHQRVKRPIFSGRSCIFSGNEISKQLAIDSKKLSYYLPSSWPALSLVVDVDHHTQGTLLHPHLTFIPVQFINFSAQYIHSCTIHSFLYITLIPVQYTYYTTLIPIKYTYSCAVQLFLYTTLIPVRYTYACTLPLFLYNTLIPVQYPHS